VKAEAGAIENVNIIAPVRAANEQLTNLRDSTFFSFMIPPTTRDEHAGHERRMNRTRRGRRFARPRRKRGKKPAVSIIAAPR
jgi:hypothetical protein